MTNQQWWRELKIRVLLRVSAWAGLPFYRRGVNEIGCTVYLVACEDESTWCGSFTVGPRFHVGEGDSREAVH